MDQVSFIVIIVVGTVEVLGEGEEGGGVKVCQVRVTA